MQNQETDDRSAALGNLIRAEKELLVLSQFIQDGIEQEIRTFEVIAEEVRGDRQKTRAAFETFDQKSGELFDVLATVLKSMRDLNSAVSRYLI